MASVKDRVVRAGEAVADKAGDAVQAVAEGVNKAAEYVKDKAGIGCGPDQGVGGIRERMDVIASCGSKVGVVDHFDGTLIKLTRKDSPDGRHHFVPLSNVGRVDEHVHLKIDSKAFEEQTQGTAACGC